MYVTIFIYLFSITLCDNVQPLSAVEKRESVTFTGNVLYCTKWMHRQRYS